MEIKVKGGRVWIPDNKQYKNKFVEIYIKKDNKDASFVYMIPEDGRFYIPLKLRQKLDIRDKIYIEKINIIKNKTREKKIIKNNKLNVSVAIPKKTLSNYEILLIEKDDKYLCWYSSQGRPQEVLLTKSLSLSFIRFLGYYQAEGEKPKLTKRRGRTLSFTNTKIEIIKDFLELSKSLIDKNLWKASIRYNKNISLKKIDETKEILKNEGIGTEKITIHEVEKLKSLSIVLWISSSLLAEIIDTLNEKIKEFILEIKNEEMFREYFRGVIAGDGTFFAYRDKNGSLHSWLCIYEEKERYIKKYKELLDKYSLKGKIKKIKNKNLFVLTIINNWDTLLKLLKYDLLLCAPHHKAKLIWTIKNHRKLRALKYLGLLNRNFDLKDIIRLSKKNYSYSFHWIEDREKENLIKFDKIKKNYTLTAKGEETKRLLTKINS